MNAKRGADATYGMGGPDDMHGGPGKGVLRGGDGDDEIDAYRFTNMETPSKEVIDCGAGTDTVRIDKGLDVETNCEYVYLS